HVTGVQTCALPICIHTGYESSCPISKALRAVSASFREDERRNGIAPPDAKRKLTLGFLKLDDGQLGRHTDSSEEAEASETTVHVEVLTPFAVQVGPLHVRIFCRTPPEVANFDAHLKPVGMPCEHNVDVGEVGADNSIPVAWVMR